MDPQQTAAGYDQLAISWRDRTPETYGITALEKAIVFANRGPALDVGCGSHGRFIEKLLTEGFDPEGVDISAEMISLAKERHPGVPFHQADITTWQPPRACAFISAWDSTFHLPIGSQAPVLEKLCSSLAPGGIILFTCGGGPAGEITGNFQGVDFGYSTLGPAGFIDVLAKSGCECLHLEHDQWPEKHVVIIARKI